MTARDAVRFTVKEYGMGGFHIMMEPCGGDLALLKFGNLYFDLPEETTLEQARKIESFLNDKIESLAYTIPIVDEEIPVDGDQ